MTVTTTMKIRLLGSATPRRLIAMGGQKTITQNDVCLLMHNETWGGGNLWCTDLSWLAFASSCAYVYGLP